MAQKPKSKRIYSSSSKGKDGKTQVDDVVNLYSIILSRYPESPGAITGNCDRDIIDFAKELISSDEFSSRMAQLQAVGDFDVIAPQKIDDLNAWLVRRGFSTEPTPAIAAEKLLAVLLRSERIEGFFAEKFGRQAPKILSRLTIEGALPIPEDWQGHIDLATEDEIRGWVIKAKQKNPARLAFYADDVLIGIADADLYRADVAAATGTSGWCGFKFIPAIGESQRRKGILDLTIRDVASSSPLPFSQKIICGRTTDATDLAILGEEVSKLFLLVKELNQKLQNLQSLRPVSVKRFNYFYETYSPPRPMSALKNEKNGVADSKISLIIGSDSFEFGRIERTIESLKGQKNPNWELVIPLNENCSAEIREYVEGVSHSEDRIRLLHTGGETILALLNRALEEASGEFVVFLRAGDKLDPAALEWCAEVSTREVAHLIYADHAERGTHGVSCFSNLKPMFDYELLLRNNYLDGFCCFRTELVRGASIESAYGLANFLHSLTLRMIEQIKFEGIFHIPLVLSEKMEERFPPSRQVDAEFRNVSQHLSRMAKRGVPRIGSVNSTIIAEDEAIVIDWLPNDPERKLAIIIPTRDGLDFLKPCVDSILAHASNPGGLEILNRKQPQCGA